MVLVIFFWYPYRSDFILIKILRVLVFQLKSVCFLLKRLLWAYNHIDNPDYQYTKMIKMIKRAFILNIKSFEVLGGVPNRNCSVFKFWSNYKTKLANLSFEFFDRLLFLECLSLKTATVNRVECFADKFW